MDIPKTEIGKYVLIKAEFSTGIIINSDNSRYNSTGNDYYLIFSGIADVKGYVEKDILSFGDKFEYLIYDHDGKFIEVMRKTENTDYAK